VSRPAARGVHTGEDGRAWLRQSQMPTITTGMTANPASAGSPTAAAAAAARYFAPQTGVLPRLRAMSTPVVAFSAMYHTIQGTAAHAASHRPPQRRARATSTQRPTPTAIPRPPDNAARARRTDTRAQMSTGLRSSSVAQAAQAARVGRTKVIDAGKSTVSQARPITSTRTAHPTAGQGPTRRRAIEYTSQATPTSINT